MRKFLAKRPSPAMAVAFVALLAAVSGTAAALPGKSSVDSGDIKNNAVKSKDIKNNEIRSNDVRNDSLTGTDIDESSLGTVPSADTAHSANSANSANRASSADTANSATTANRANSAENVDTLKSAYKRVTASATNTDHLAARAAATEVPLFSRGPFSFYGKCFVVSNVDFPEFTQLVAETFARTTEAGSILEADFELSGGPNSSGFFDPDTPEADTRIRVAQAAANDAEIFKDPFVAAAPDGTAISGQTNLAVKRGDLGDNGIYGAGDVCIFWGYAIG